MTTTFDQLDEALRTEGAPAAPVGEDSSPDVTETPPRRPPSGAAKRKMAKERAAARAAEAEGPSVPSEGPRRGIFGERRPKAPKPKNVGGRPRKRETVAPLAAFCWRQVGAFLEATPYYPSGRIMGWQALAAGEVLDELAAGTWVDEKALQPLMRQEKKAEAAAMLLGPPLLAGIMAQSPEQRERLAPMLRFVVRQSLVVMLPAMEKARAREEAELAAIAKVFGDEMPEGMTVDDLVASILTELFTPPTRATPAEPMEPTP